MSEMKYVITISRQFGSLGRPIAEKVAEKLGINFYDRDIIEAAAEKLKLSVSEASALEEQVKDGFLYMRYPLGATTAPEIQDRLYEVESNIIMSTTEDEDCVIVGRCSEYLFRNRPRHLAIFIYAPYSARMQNCVDTLGLTEREASQMIRQVDRARNAYHKRYTRYSAGDPQYHDAMLDSSTFGIEGTADVIVDMARRKLGI